MRNNNLIWCLFLCLCYLSPSTRVTVVGQNNRQQRAAPLIDMRPTITSEEAKAQKALVRSYLWDLWKMQRRASFIVRSYSLEGEPTDCKYLVEPSSAGNWHIVCRCITVCPFLSKARCRKYFVAHKANYDVVERKELADREKTLSPNIPDDRRLSPLQFILVLRNTASGARIEL
jgi:hypothetical protein